MNFYLYYYYGAMKGQIRNKKDDKEDLRWVRKAKRGNRKAFEKLVFKYQKRVYFTVRKMVMDHSDSNDIIQDTFVKVYMNLHKFDEQFPFYPWLHRIAINTTLNHQTKTSRRKEMYTIDGEEEFIQVKSNDKNPLKEVIQNELEVQVYHAMEQLPVEQRTVFILRTSEGLSYQEISQQLNISLGTVMSRLSRAREKLKDLLQPYLTDKDIGG